MTTYITATPNPLDATVRLRVEAREDGYEDALNLDTYELDAAGIAAELEHWTLPAGVTHNGGPRGDYLGFDVEQGAGTVTLTRSVTGLDVGQTYRLLAAGYFTSTGGGAIEDMSTLAFGIVGQTLKPYYENYAGQSSSGGYADGDVGRTVYVAEWEATATSAEIAYEISAPVQGAQLQVFALVVQTTPSTRGVLETYGQAPDDGLWTLYGAVPGDVARAVDVWTQGAPGARAIGFTLTNVGSGDVPLAEDTYGQSLVVSGLTPGLTYTARAYLAPAREPSNVPTPPAPPWVRLVVDGVTDGASEPSWSGWQRVRFVATATSHVLRAQLVNAVTLAPGESVALHVHYARVDLEDELTDARRIVGLTRSDGNGARDVRPIDGVRMEDGTLILTDHEAALTGLLVYTVATQRVDVPEPATTTEVATASTRLDVAGNRFTQVVTPRLTAAARLVETYEAGQASSAVVHEVIDRRDPLVTRGPTRLRRGRMTVWRETYEAAMDLAGLFEAGDEVLWRQSDYAGLDMYFTLDTGGVRVRPYDAVTDPRRWAVELDYVEVAVPTTPIAGDATWNFRTVAELGTFWDVLRAYPTVADLLNGPVT